MPRRLPHLLCASLALALAMASPSAQAEDPVASGAEVTTATERDQPHWAAPVGADPVGALRRVLGSAAWRIDPPARVLAPTAPKFSAEDSNPSLRRDGTAGMGFRVAEALRVGVATPPRHGPSRPLGLVGTVTVVFD